MYLYKSHILWPPGHLLDEKDILRTWELILSDNLIDPWDSDKWSDVILNVYEGYFEVRFNQWTLNNTDYVHNENGSMQSVEGFTRIKIDLF